MPKSDEVQYQVAAMLEDAAQTLIRAADNLKAEGFGVGATNRVTGVAISLASLLPQLARYESAVPKPPEGVEVKYGKGPLGDARVEFIGKNNVWARLQNGWVTTTASCLQDEAHSLADCVRAAADHQGGSQ